MTPREELLAPPEAGGAAGGAPPPPSRENMAEKEVRRSGCWTGEGRGEGRPAERSAAVRCGVARCCRCAGGGVPATPRCGVSARELWREGSCISVAPKQSVESSPKSELALDAWSKALFAAAPRFAAKPSVDCSHGWSSRLIARPESARGLAASSGCGSASSSSGAKSAEEEEPAEWVSPSRAHTVGRIEAPASAGPSRAVAARESARLKNLLFIVCCRQSEPGLPPPAAGAAGPSSAGGGSSEAAEFMLTLAGVVAAAHAADRTADDDDDSAPSAAVGHAASAAAGGGAGATSAAPGGGFVGVVDAAGGLAPRLVFLR